MGGHAGGINGDVVVRDCIVGGSITPIGGGISEKLAEDSITGRLRRQGVACVVVGYSGIRGLCR